MQDFASIGEQPNADHRNRDQMQTAIQTLEDDAHVVEDSKPPTKVYGSQRSSSSWSSHKINPSVTGKRSGSPSEPLSNRSFRTAFVQTLSTYRNYQRTMPTIIDNALGAVGHTPLIRLDKIAKANGLKCNLCEFTVSNRLRASFIPLSCIVGKVEFMSAGGSVKDRISKAMVEAAEKEGKLMPGKSVVIEPTSGNTGSFALQTALPYLLKLIEGIGLAMACAIKVKERRDAVQNTY